MSQTNEVATRSLILDNRDELIVPSSRDRLTFDTTVSHDGDSLHERVESALSKEYAMQPLITRRYLGEFGVAQAYLLTPWQGKPLERTFAWQRRGVDVITDRISQEENGIDETDIKIYRKFLELIQNNQLPITTELSSAI